MNWDAVGAIAELLAAIGALAALIYLALQIRHNTEALRKSELAARSATGFQGTHYWAELNKAMEVQSDCVNQKKMISTNSWP